MSIKVAIVDDHKLFRTSFTLLVSQIEQVEVTLQCANAIELLEGLKATAVDVVFLDIHMPVMDGFELLPKLHKYDPKLKIIILSSSSDSYTVERMLEYNISGYLTKNVGFSQIRKALSCVLDNGLYYDNQIKEIVENTLPRDKKHSLHVSFTSKEIEIIKLFAQQHSGRVIAQKLHVSPRTIEKHKEILMQKTQTNNFLGVVVYALTRHYITEEDLL